MSAENQQIGLMPFQTVWSSASSTYPTNLCALGFREWESKVDRPHVVSSTTGLCHMRHPSCCKVAVCKGSLSLHVPSARQLALSAENHQIGLVPFKAACAVWSSNSRMRAGNPTLLWMAVQPSAEPKQCDDRNLISRPPLFLDVQSWT